MDKIDNLSQEENLDIPHPVWKDVYCVTHRPLWEVAAIAGNVEPKLNLVILKKSSDPKWKEKYEKYVRAMTIALMPIRENLPDHVYYDLQRSGNSTLIKNRRDLRKVRVEMLSAVEFLLKRFGGEEFTKDFHEVHKHLIAQREFTVKENLKHEEIESTRDSEKSKNPSHRDQTKANNTKEINRLHAIIYTLACKVVDKDFNFDLDADNYNKYSKSKELLCYYVEDAYLQGIEGFSKNGVENILNKSFDTYWDFINKKNKNKNTTD